MWYENVHVPLAPYSRQIKKGRFLPLETSSLDSPHHPLASSLVPPVASHGNAVYITIPSLKTSTLYLFFKKSKYVDRAASSPSQPFPDYVIS
jgi:hypothetical protein